jgi:hypothetical protein
VRTDGYFRLPRGRVLSAFQPHMHNRGKAMCMEAIYPTSAPTPPPGPGAHRDDQLRQQLPVRLAHHLPVRRRRGADPAGGTIIHVTSWHDNTAANKYNPNPRNWVGYGQRTIDEMSFAWVSLFYIDEAEYQQRIAARAKTHE